ncbi:hypothetical protein [Altericista sp. CCNU0014]|uniref:hypothetical protein n=1 Tax=Altericista sp. CCNU0014 TaxID=3082949 RepID=UPI003850DB45
MTDPIQPITLPPSTDPQGEAVWLRQVLQQWLNEEFLPEPANDAIAQRAASVYLRQRMEGEDDVGCLLVAILTEMQTFDFSKSFYSEFAVANAVSDLLLNRFLEIDSCCPG